MNCGGAVFLDLRARADAIAPDYHVISNGLRRTKHPPGLPISCYKRQLWQRRFLRRARG